jgi:predicted membrane chloride channel (bestrophin family)
MVLFMKNALRMTTHTVRPATVRDAKAIAEEIENPFNDDESDLPTEAMSKNIKISTEELLLNL